MPPFPFQASSAVRGFSAFGEGDREGAASHRSDGPHVGDLPRTRSVQQEQLAADSDHEAARGGRPAAWPRRSPDAPPDPATRGMGGRDTMPDEQYAQEAARMTIRHGSGKSAEAILAGWVGGGWGMGRGREGQWGKGGQAGVGRGIAEPYSTVRAWC